jgi:serine protease Do
MKTPSRISTLCLSALLAFAPMAAAAAEPAPVADAFEGLLREEALRIKVVQKAEPAVVSIVVSGTPKTPEGSTPEKRGIATVGGGTAFFVSADGLLLTNNHVVDPKATQHTVILNSGKRLTAKVVFTDGKNDVALLKVDARNMPYLKLARRNTVYLAQTVIAIGNTLGTYSNTVSVGIISGLGRSITASNRSGDFVENLDQVIQTDAAINEGSSGGPLLNSRGEVIGMNVAFIAGSQSIGFAIPVAALRAAMQTYRNH